MANVEVDMEEARPGPPICRPAKGAADLLSVKKEARILPAFLRPTLLRPTHALSRPSSATQSASAPSNLAHGPPRARSRPGAAALPNDEEPALSSGLIPV